MYQKVENRALFAKKSSAARDKLMQMGGVNPQQAGIASMQGMLPRPQPAAPAGIMASSPDLMQAAMRKAPVLPAQQGMAPQPAPMPAPQPMPLPPSQPIPNIAGIPQGPAPTAPAPRPQPQQPGVRKMAAGGEPMRGRFGQPQSFKEAYEFGQKAATMADPRELGLPKDAANTVKTIADANKKDPEKVGSLFVDQIVPADQRTGDVKKDLMKAAQLSGIERVPAEAEVDELNKAIAGATLGAAMAGSYVNPNTGQELRPTAGARIGRAVAEGLMLKRDTETRRAKQEAELAKAKMAANAKSAKAPKLPENQKRLLDLFEERAKVEDPSKVAAKFNEEFGAGVGDQVLSYYQTAGLGSQPSANTSQSSPYPVGYEIENPKTGEVRVWDGNSWQPK